MKAKPYFLIIVLTLLAGVHQSAAQDTQLFQVVGPTATIITAFRPDGTIVWSNAQPGETYTIQTVASPRARTNWVDYVQIPPTDSVNTNRLIDFNPPAGMALIPEGAFTMGDTLDGDSDAVPIRVTVSGFYMDRKLVSYGQWQTVYNWATNHGYSFDFAGSGKSAEHPVETIHWYDSVKWCNARSEQAGLVPAYYIDAAQTTVYRTGQVNVQTNWVNWSSGYRLPTEAEWEKAARGGLSGQRFPWGNVITESFANYYGCTSCDGYDFGPDGYNSIGIIGDLPYTSPVGSFVANGYGLYDMAGNVFEWCEDWYGMPYVGGNDPYGPGTGSARVLRGGDWHAPAVYSRCAKRGYAEPFVANNEFGFRCVRGL
jgi:formylglycine-generating enzyme